MPLSGYLLGVAMRSFALRLLMVLVAIAQPLPSVADGATLTVSAVVLPNARCSFTMPAVVNSADLLALAARQTSFAAESGALRCGGHAPTARNALTLTQLTVRQLELGATSDFVMTITP